MEKSGGVKLGIAGYWQHNFTQLNRPKVYGTAVTVKWKKI